MTGEINLPTLPPTPAAGQSSAPAPGALLKLLEPQIGLIDPGKTANAEVIALKQGGEAFQLLLKLTLDGGRQTLVQASSAQPLPLGSNVAVSQTPAGNLTLSLQQALSANVAALTRIDTAKVPEGTLLQAKVLTTQMLPQGTAQPAIYRSLVTVLNNVLAGATLTVESPQPLRVGSLLSAVVQNAQTLNFVPLSGLKDQLAVTQQLSTQQSRQGSLDAVFTALQNLPRGDSTSADLRAAADRLLAALPDLAQVSNPKVLAQVIQNSGAFLEAKLLAGQNPQIPPLDMKGALLRLVADLLPALPASTNLNAILAANTLAQVLPNFVRSPLNTLGQVSARQAPVSFPLPERLMAKLEGEGDLENLLRLAAGAISRLQSHQLSSLEQTGTTADGPPANHLAVGNPYAHAAGHRAVAGQVPARRTGARQRPARTQRPQRPQANAMARRAGIRYGAAGAVAGPGTTDPGQTVEPTVGNTPVHRQPDRKPFGQLARAAGDFGHQRRRPRLPPGYATTRAENRTGATLGG
ncbi:hypothetical protein ACVWXD_003232 [Pseudomonas sp. TE3911]